MTKHFDHRFEAYAHHGSGSGPFVTERVDIRLRPTRNGNYQALVAGRWRRVWIVRDDGGYVEMTEGPVHIQIVRNDA